MAAALPAVKAQVKLSDIIEKARSGGGYSGIGPVPGDMNSFRATSAAFSGFRLCNNIDEIGHGDRIAVRVSINSNGPYVSLANPRAGLVDYLFPLVFNHVNRGADPIVCTMNASQDVYGIKRMSSNLIIESGDPVITRLATFDQLISQGKILFEPNARTALGAVAPSSRSVATLGPSSGYEVPANPATDALANGRPGRSFRNIVGFANPFLGGKGFLSRKRRTRYKAKRSKRSKQSRRSKSRK